MRVLITGANGFIARELIAQLHDGGHEIVACVRKPSEILNAYSNVRQIVVDFCQDTVEAVWLDCLNHIDVVINCAGVFQAGHARMWAIHYDAPKVLFQAAKVSGVKKIIQISALSIDVVDTPFAQSKLAIEKELANIDIDSVIIRPSFVYGSGSYGGSSLLRGLAGLPFITVLPGGGKQKIQPIALNDLAKLVVESLSLKGKHVLCAVGSETISLKAVISKLRAWLGFKKTLTLNIPMKLLSLLAKLGDMFRHSPLSSTGVKMMQVDNVATESQIKTTQQALSFQPKGFSQGLARMSSSVQDRWHARLYMLRPLLILSIAFIWLWSGVMTLVPASHAREILAQAGFSQAWQPIVLYGSAVFDVVLGFLTLIRFRLKLLGAIQCLAIVVYTVLISVLLPHYWFSPLAPLAKNMPIIFAILIMMALESSR